MSVELEPSELRHRVGKCPACRDYLWAWVTVLITVGTPKLDEGGEGSVVAFARPIAMRLNHECDQRAELPEWEAALLRAPADPERAALTEGSDA